jgi:CRISPR/Cas system-associated exonuclease Cas4 (RecB family)
MGTGFLWRYHQPPVTGITFYGDIISRLLPTSCFHSGEMITKRVESLLRMAILNKAPTGSALWHINTETMNYNVNSTHTSARPGRKQATATEDFDVHISHL